MNFDRQPIGLQSIIYRQRICSSSSSRCPMGSTDRERHSIKGQWAMRRSKPAIDGYVLQLHYPIIRKVSEAKEV